MILIFSFIGFLISCGGKQERTQSLTTYDTDAIEKYLDEKMMNPEFGGKVFSSYEIFKSADDKVYLWAYLQEYYKKDKVLTTGTGWSVPAVLSVDNSGGILKAISHKVPMDGMDYSNDIKSMFPEDIQQRIFDYPGSSSIQKLEKESKSRAEKFFN